MTVSDNHRRWLVVFAFAVCMAWVEAACVYYLRVMIDRVNPYQPTPLPMHGGLGGIELVREAATLVMLAAIGWLGGRTARARFGYLLIAFGAWDIFYYVFLRTMGDWPASLFDWDILFLLPLPWWGPVVAPAAIAVLMIAGGTLASQSSVRLPRGPARALFVSCGIGILLALYVFMADALAVLGQGPDAARHVLPTAFNWPVFGVALALMAAPVAAMAGRTLARGDGPSPARSTSTPAARPTY